MPDIPAGYADLIKAFALFLFVIWLYLMRKPIADRLRQDPRHESLSRWKRILAILRGRD